MTNMFSRTAMARLEEHADTLERLRHTLISVQTTPCTVERAKRVIQQGEQKRGAEPHRALLTVLCAATLTADETLRIVGVDDEELLDHVVPVSVLSRVSR